ncbi:C40 family peptidase [Brachybacterium hainanense]|uniref:NlpC/P60 family protein n=1 Tax=Brachybacterium hainanense TaxID=1541174 RepID=A0ABV6R9G5_9MICO
MTKHNTHRAAGRARNGATRYAYKGLGGAAMLGTVVVGSAFAAQSATAAPIAEAPAAPTTNAAAPVEISTAHSSEISTLLSSTSTLYQGKKGDRVEALQTLLNAEGANLEVDGKFGPRTNDAVLDYQSENGLQVDGRVGPETRGSLSGGVSTSSAKAESSSDSSDSEKSSSKSSSRSGESIVDAARQYIGVDYDWAGSSPSGFDCSGLTQYVYAQFGIDLPHSSSKQASGGDRISQSEAQPGDLVVWPGHIGIYAGNGKVVDAGSSKGSVSERSIWGNPSFVTYR